MSAFSVGGPQTIFDWIALRDEFRGKVHVLDIDALSVMYGLSNTNGYRDDHFANEVEDFLATSKDPIRLRYYFAYQLSSRFWDTYESWAFDPEQSAEDKKASGLIEGFRDKVLKWLLDGLAMYSDDMEVMDSAFLVVSRIGNYDTILDEADIPLLETAAGKEISMRTSEGGRQLFEIFRKFFNNHAVKKGTDQPGNRPPKPPEMIH